jgi:galactose oxidase
MRLDLLHRRIRLPIRLLIASAGLVLSLARVAEPAPPAALPASAASASQGVWSPLINFAPAVVAIHTSVLPNGKLLLWERFPGQPEPQWSNTYVWDPAGTPLNKLKDIKNTFANVFCAGHNFLPDGRLLVAGGHDRFDGWGTKTLLFFDSRTEQWSRGPDMNKGRWYPTTTALANGDVLAISGEAQGDVEAPSFNDLPQVWNGTLWRDLTDARRRQSLYPWMLLAPSGKVFWAGPEAATAFLDTSGKGTWSDGPARPGDLYRDYGSAVQYEPGKVLVVGGGDPPTNTAMKIDLNADAPVWQTAGSMRYARRQLNATLLPDGKVLVTGGTSSPGFNNGAAPVRATEMWDPQTGQWSELAPFSQDVKRLYHSTAALLPDGRVLSAGGGLPAADNDNNRNYPNAQVFSPPYLFAGARPSIASLPPTLRYGARFIVKTPDAASIRQVTLLRLGSVTHAFDQSQRFVRLAPPAQVPGGLEVTAPARGEIAPPGPYLLFILNGAGVPSVAKVVELGK